MMACIAAILHPSKVLGNVLENPHVSMILLKPVNDVCDCVCSGDSATGALQHSAARPKSGFV